MFFLNNKKIIILIFAVFMAAVVFLPAESYAAGLVPCGGAGESACTLCHLIVGFNGVINKALKLAFFIGLAVLAFAAVTYIVSAGDSGMIGTAKSAIKNSVIGIIIMFSAWLMVNYTMQLLGTKPDLGIMYVGSWDKFQCAGQNANTGGTVSVSEATPGSGTPSASEAIQQSGQNVALGESCGINNSGKCMDTTLAVCPMGTSHVWGGGNDCEWGAGCCK